MNEATLLKGLLDTDKVDDVRDLLDRYKNLSSKINVQYQDVEKNRTKAMRTLRARIVEAERAKQEAETAQTRKSQVGTGDRSEKIRTYNFPQNRVTDHRIGLTLHKLDQVLAGDLDEIVEGLRANGGLGEPHG